MTLRRRQRSRRKGAAAVETALVMILFTSIVFGIFEYCRMYMDWNLMNNAAREGCRFALANNTDTALTSEVTTLVTNYMGGDASSLSNFTVSISGSANGVVTAPANLQAGNMINVTVSGTYKFMNIVPVIKMPTNFTMKSTVSMVCEGGL